jgi:alpha-N-arabinofuranosidase
VQALRAIKVPVVRWPGGCFAEQYNWREGIGPADHRVSTVNKNWGNVLEPNTFGTDEFMDFIDQIGSEAYISVNVGSSTPQEAAAWFEYMTTSMPTTLAKERAANGHEAPYRVKYLGLGNESWGCGGPYEPDVYVQQMKRFGNFVKDLNPAQMSPSLLDPKYKPNPEAMKRVASAGFEFSEPVMKAWKGREPWYWDIEGISVHSYTFGGFPGTFPATDFGEKEYAKLIKETLGMNGVIAAQSAIMDKYDPKKQVALVIDEWGAWLKPIPGTNPEFLKQQNSLRDGILAALNLNIFA